MAVSEEKDLLFSEKPISPADEITTDLFETHGLIGKSREDISSSARAYLQERDDGDRRAEVAQILMGRELYGSGPSDPDYLITCFWADPLTPPEQVISALEIFAIAESMEVDISAFPISQVGEV